jgi:hypothetical protein
MEKKMAPAATRLAPFPDLPIDAFLYGHEGPWPQPSRDHPFGLAPGIYRIPQEEWDDWTKYVQSYYRDNVVEFGLRSAVASGHRALKPNEYPDISDADFNTLVCEGLYSKFLSKLDAQDERIFRDYMTDPAYDYLKSDYSCMRVVRITHVGETVAASVALVRRPKNDVGYHYDVVAIQLQVWDPASGQFKESEIFTKEDKGVWPIARLFLLQGAIHRINLIDHTEVHFPADAINAITKTVLPKNNLVLRLMQPHMWLSMPVNNTVLEGQRSLINRNTWYMWSPFVAQGDEVRKLLPFGWFGSQYYSAALAPLQPYKDAYFDNPNSSYPPFVYDPTPPAIPSLYGEFLNAYFPPIRKFVRGVLEHMDDTDWQEVRFWAHHIAIWIPGFPSADDLTGADGTSRNPELLADVLAHFIWNASVRHSADHQTLHEMIAGGVDAAGNKTPARPVPFILRVVPPLRKNYTLKAQSVDDSQLGLIERAEKFYEWVTDQVPLCWPADLNSAYWADLLFYQPHNSWHLTQVEADIKGDPNRFYAFDSEELKNLVRQFHADLVALDGDLKEKHPEKHFVPLGEIASSIQY